MTKRLGVREIVRNFSMLEDYDFVEIEDKKTHKLKGAFISSRLLGDVKEIIEKKEKERKQKRLDDIMQFVGIVDGDFGDMTAQDIKAKMRKKYYDE